MERVSNNAKPNNTVFQKIQVALLSVPKVRRASQIACEGLEKDCSIRFWESMSLIHSMPGSEAIIRQQ
ncbi:MAG: hypothetical protein DWH94_11700 [Planctomycetota bacterium]|nr:MAG: hypothetical protein DWH94_11700 [Planctomycetota bacterium]